MPLPLPWTPCACLRPSREGRWYMEREPRMVGCRMKESMPSPDVVEWRGQWRIIQGSRASIDPCP